MSRYIPKEIVLNNLELPDGVTILYTTWRIVDESNTVVHYTDRDEVNLTSKVFTDVFEVGKKYYVTMSMVRTDGPTIDTRPLEVLVFSGEETYNLYPLPSVADTPVITMDYALDNTPNNDIKFTASDMVVAGNATHDYSNWWLTNDLNEVIWDSLKDQLNKTEIVVSSVDLKRDRFYTMHCVYTATNRDSTGTGSITFRPNAFDELELVGDLNNTYYGYSIETRLKDLNSDMTLFEYKLLGNDTELFSTSNTTGIVDLSSITLVDTYEYYILRLRLTTSSSVLGWKDIKFSPRSFIVDSDTWNDLDFQYENRIEVLDGKILNYDKSDYNISFTTPNGKTYQLPNGEIILLRTKTKIGRFSIDEDTGVLTHLGDLYLPQVTLNKDYNIFNFKIFNTGDVLIGVGYTDYKLYRFKYDPVNNSFKYITNYVLDNGGTNTYSEMHLVGNKVLFISDGIIGASTQNLYSINLTTNILELVYSNVIANAATGNLVRLDDDDLLLRGGVSKLNRANIINSGKLIHSTAGVISTSVDSRISLPSVGVTDESALQATLRNNELILGNFNRFKLKSNTRDEMKLIGITTSENRTSKPILAPNGMLYCIPNLDSKVLKIDTTNDTTTLIGMDLGTGTNKYLYGIIVGKDIYCIPNSASKVLKIDTTNDTTTLIGMDLGTGTDKYQGGIVKTSNGMIYCAPVANNKVLKIDTNTDTVSLVGTDYGNTHGKYYNAVLAQNGMIYCAPKDNVTGSNRVLKINPTNDTTTLIGMDFGSSVDNYLYSYVLAQNGMIYYLPYYGTNILKVNPITDTVTQIGPNLGANSIGIKVLRNVLLPNGVIYCPPTILGKVLKIDTNTDTISLVGTDYGAGTNKYNSIILASNGMIYCPPTDSTVTRVLKINPTNDTTTLIGMDLGNVDGKYKYAVITALNNDIYCIPNSASKVLKIDTTNDTTTLIGMDLGTGTDKYLIGSILAENGKIYAPPYANGKVLMIDPSGVDTLTFNLKKLPADKNTMVDTTPFIFKSNGGEDFKFTIFLNNGKRIFMSYSKDIPKMILYK